MASCTMTSTSYARITNRDRLHFDHGGEKYAAGGAERNNCRAPQVQRQASGCRRRQDSEFGAGIEQEACAHRATDYASTSIALPSRRKGTA